MAYDVGRGVAVMFGGQDGVGVAYGDTWEWNGFGWLARSVATAPQARSGHGLVFDTRRSRVVLFGGHSAAGAPLSDTWEWDGNAWQLRATASSPQARSGQGMAYDSIRWRVVLHGGVGVSNALLGDTWEFDGNDWQVHAAVAGPSARRGSAMTFDDTRGNVVLFGGDDGTQALSDTWTFDGTGWTQRLVAAPSARSQAQVAHDTLCGRSVLHGGADSLGANLGDSWAWDGAAWTQLSGASPSARRGAAMAVDAQRGQTMLFGGQGATALAETWQLASPCSRTMTVVTPPQVGSTASFRFDYPRAAAGHWYFHLLTANQVGSYPVPVPGIASIGLSRVDLFNIYLQPSGLLDPSGSNVLSVGIPLDNVLAGLPIDVQSVDFSWQTHTLYWAGNDAEVSIAPVTPPVANFTATPTFGMAPLVVQFADTSTNAPTSWQWDFDNDGIVDSTQRNPSWVYGSNGAYSVRLTVSNLAGSRTVTSWRLIYVGWPNPAPNPLLNMMRIEAGTFQMGSTVVGGTAVPVHSVTITQPFWCGKHEVTQAEYQAVRGTNPSFFQGSGYSNAPQRPVERVTWNNAMAYCSSLTATEAAAGRVPAGYQYRLPTEAEWEYVCRAGTTTEFNRGASLSRSQANFASSSYGQTTIVGLFIANPWGLFDTHGNVWEWCLDSWDGSANYPSSAVADPYVSSGPFRVLRGGGWDTTEAYCRSANRSFYSPASTLNNTGFRIVLAPILVP